MSWVMNRMALPNCACMSFMSRRTCACTVTSSAVVGSSAMRSAGLQASAMAITTRWRMPPENSCGYCVTRSSGEGTPTSRSSSTARASARLARQALVLDEHLADLVADGIDRVERRHRLLEDHGDVLAAQTPHGAPEARGRRCRAPAPSGREQDAAAATRRAGGRRQEAHDRESGQRLAAAAFADDCRACARTEPRSSRRRGPGARSRPSPKRRAGPGHRGAEIGRHVSPCAPAATSPAEPVRGSSRSRSQSPMKLKATTVSMMARPGNGGQPPGDVDERPSLLEHAAPGGDLGRRAETEEGEAGFDQDDEAELERRDDEQRARHVDEDVPQQDVGGREARPRCRPG